MSLQEYIYRVIENPTEWRYYDKDIKSPDLNNPESCRNFIHDFTLLAKKSGEMVYLGLEYLANNDRIRFEHIVDTYFLGIALFNDRRLYFGRSIRNYLKHFEVFKELDEKEINKEFNYVWFLITLYHDLGYRYECGDYPREEILSHKMSYKPTSIPHKYVALYLDYERIKHNGDHGICGGLEFDRDLCYIREAMSQVDNSLSWSKALEEVYHDVAWIIIAHNIWWNRVDYEHPRIEGALSGLNISGSKKEDGSYKTYPINRQKYSLFTLFCLVDTIEPLKRHISLNQINIDVFKGHIYLQVDGISENKYVKDIEEANSWLMPIKLIFDNVLDIECPKIASWGVAGYHGETSIVGVSKRIL